MISLYSDETYRIHLVICTDLAISRTACPAPRGAPSFIHAGFERRHIRKVPGRGVHGFSLGCSHVRMILHETWGTSGSCYPAAIQLVAIDITYFKFGKSSNWLNHFLMILKSYILNYRRCRRSENMQTGWTPLKTCFVKNKYCGLSLASAFEDLSRATIQDPGKRQRLL